MDLNLEPQDQKADTFPLDYWDKDQKPFIWKLIHFWVWAVILNDWTITPFFVYIDNWFDYHLNFVSFIMLTIWAVIK